MKRIILISGLTALTACSFATTLYSTDFEAANGYTDGSQLASVPDWNISDFQPNNYVVSSSKGQSGTQSALYDTDAVNSFGWAYVGLSYDPTATTEKILEGSVAIYITNDARGNSQFGIDAYQGSSFIGQLGMFDNSVSLDDQVGTTPAGTINYDQWNTFTLRLNYADNKMTGLVNGVEVASAAFDGSVATDFDLYAGSYGYNKGYFDDYNVKSTSPVPEPMTLTALGLGALGLIRKKRKA